MPKILIVDDMAVSLMITENILSDKYETVCASSGEEAIKEYRREKPDMVLSDLRMPGMSGFELQQALQDEYRDTIPFMFMTADHDEEIESAGFDNGAMDFIRKPFRPDVLLRRVENILSTVERIKGLKRHASIDSLTGLLNKAAAQKELTDLCLHANGALMMIDLDSFKLVNDIYGHSMGDKILISFADIIRSAVRPADLVGRLGGDEFIAFCHGMHDEVGIAHKSEFINEQLVSAAKKLMGDDMNIPLGASIGCVFVPAEGTDFAVLHNKADKALYMVKQNGKHGFEIFRKKNEFEGEQVSASGIGNIEMILGERGAPEGALVLPIESFRAVYRFLRRTIGDYTNVSCIVVFQFEKNFSAEAEEAFADLLKKTLRRGDVVTQNNAAQFLAILSNTEVPEHAVKRINENWQKNPYGNKFPFSCEWAIMDI